MANEHGARTDGKASLAGAKVGRRLVSFRIAEEQYVALRKASAFKGARSVSDFARSSVLDGMESSTMTAGSLLCDLTTLTSRLKEIDAQLRTTRLLIARILGAGAAETEEAQDGAPLSEQEGRNR